MQAILAFCSAVISWMKSVSRMNGEGIKPIHVFLFRACLLLVAPVMFRYCLEVWRDTRDWLGLPMIPDYYFGTAEEFFSSALIIFAITVAFAWVRIENFCEYSGLDEDFVSERRQRNWHWFFVAMIVFLVVDTIYMIFRWGPIAVTAVLTWLSIY